MLTFLSVALLVYASMHLYVFGKAWQVLPHSRMLALMLAAAGITLPSPLFSSRSSKPKAGAAPPLPPRG